MNAVIQHEDAKIMEGVLLGGDLSQLTSAQRVTYYQRVCESMGLNPLTKPFSYIQLNGKLTLYALKDAADQLRKLHGVSIDDVDIVESETQFTVKVKGHDKTGRSDVEVGVVSKKDMQGKQENVQMKAVTKAKRRLTLSICGLGMLDETEIETIPNARPVEIAETGEITNNPDAPSEDLKYRYMLLVERAKAAKVPFTIPDWDKVTKAELTAEGLQLLGFVSEAEKQDKIEMQEGEWVGDEGAK